MSFSYWIIAYILTSLFFSFLIIDDQTRAIIRKFAALNSKMIFYCFWSTLNTLFQWKEHILIFLPYCYCYYHTISKNRCPISKNQFTNLLVLASRLCQKDSSLSSRVKDKNFYPKCSACKMASYWLCKISIPIPGVLFFWIIFLLDFLQIINGQKVVFRIQSFKCILWPLIAFWHISNNKSFGRMK